MSWYVDYYVGYKTKEGKIYPLGHFDCFGNLRPVLTKSRSFASNLWERFQRVTLVETTEELKKHFPGNFSFDLIFIELCYLVPKYLDFPAVFSNAS